MNPEQNLDLLSAYRMDPSLRNRNAVVEANLGLVEKAADRFSQLSRIPFQDLCGVGWIGLIKAVERFDLARGNKFSSFAMPVILSEMQHEKRDGEDLITAPRSLVDDFNRLRRAHDKMLAAGVEVTYSELAESMGVDLDEVARCRDLTHSFVWLDAHDGGDDGPTIDLAAPEEPDEYAWLYDALKTLPSVRREILVRHYLARETVPAIALSTGIAVSTVEVWLVESLTQLRRHAGIEPAAPAAQPQRTPAPHSSRGGHRDGRENVRRGRAIAPGDPRLQAVS